MGTEIVNYDKAWAEKAREESERAPVSEGRVITTSGATFRLGGEDIPGNVLIAVVLDYAYENTFFGVAYDPENKSPPKCFAISNTEKGLSPHESLASHEFFEQQTEGACSSCPMNEFGSADTGKGKACKNRVRLALISAGHMEPIKGVRNAYAPTIYEDEPHYRSDDITFLKVPPTSIKAWKKYVKDCEKNYQRPPHGLITRIDIVPGKDGGFGLAFETLDAFPADFFATLNARHVQARSDIMRPYQPPSEEDTAPAPRAGGVSRLKQLRK